MRRKRKKGGSRKNSEEQEEVTVRGMKAGVPEAEKKISLVEARTIGSSTKKEEDERGGAKRENENHARASRLLEGKEEHEMSEKGESLNWSFDAT